MKSSESLTVPPCTDRFSTGATRAQQVFRNETLITGGATFVLYICLKLTNTEEQESDSQFPAERGVPGTWEHPAFWDAQMHWKSNSQPSSSFSRKPSHTTRTTNPVSGEHGDVSINNWALSAPSGLGLVWSCHQIFDSCKTGERNLELRRAGNTQIGIEKRPFQFKTPLYVVQDVFIILVIAHNLEYRIISTDPWSALFED